MAKVVKVFLKKFFLLKIFITILSSSLRVTGNNISINRQKMILKLSNDLYIKNIILLKSSSLIIDDKILSFAKSLFKCNINFSFLSSKEIELLMNNFSGSKVKFLKSLILTFEKESNLEIYAIITRNERSAYKFSWLTWDKRNGIILSSYFYIPYNTQLLMVDDGLYGKENISVILEIYHPRILSQMLFSRLFGIWWENKRLELDEADIYKRRFDMNGTELIVMLDRHLEYFMWSDLVNAIVTSMNFRYTSYLSIAPLNRRTGFWEIYLKPLLCHEPNIGENKMLGLTKKSEVSMYIRKDELIENYGISHYTRPFSKELWLMILLSIIIAGMCTVLFVNATKGVKKSASYGLLDSLYHPIEAFTNQSGSEDPKEKSIRLIIIITRLIAMFIVPAYSAFILSFILNPSVKLPFEDIKEFVQDGTYRFGFSIKGNYDGVFNETKEPWLKNAYENYSLKLSERPATEAEAREKLCQLRKTAFLILKDNIFDVRCKIVKIPTPVLKGWLALELRENSSFKRIFNRIFKKIYSAGIYNRFDRIFYSQQYQPKNFQTKEEENSVNIKSVTPILQITIILYLISIINLFFECLFKKFIK